MFDKISDAAEKVATNVSRRAFLGRLGQGALGLASVIGGVLAFPVKAEASHLTCCLECLGGPCTRAVCVATGAACPTGFVAVGNVGSCNQCTCKKFPC